MHQSAILVLHPTETIPESFHSAFNCIRLVLDDTSLPLGFRVVQTPTRRYIHFIIVIDTVTIPGRQSSWSSIAWIWWQLHILDIHDFSWWMAIMLAIRLNIFQPPFILYCHLEFFHFFRALGHTHCEKRIKKSVFLGGFWEEQKEGYGD